MLEGECEFCVGVIGIPPLEEEVTLGLCGLHGEHGVSGGLIICVMVCGSGAVWVMWGGGWGCCSSNWGTDGAGW